MRTIRWAALCLIGLSAVLFSYSGSGPSGTVKLVMPSRADSTPPSVSFLSQRLRVPPGFLAQENADPLRALPRPPAPVQVPTPTTTTVVVTPRRTAPSPVHYRQPSPPIVQTGFHHGYATALLCVMNTENGGSYGRSSNPSHFGRYQFDRQTWAAYGGNPATWGIASPAEQDRVFFAAVAAGDLYHGWLEWDGC